MSYYTPATIGVVIITQEDEGYFAVQFAVHSRSTSGPRKILFFSRSKKRFFRGPNCGPRKIFFFRGPKFCIDFELFFIFRNKITFSYINVFNVFFDQQKLLLNRVRSTGTDFCILKCTQSPHLDVYKVVLSPAKPAILWDHFFYFIVYTVKNRLPVPEPIFSFRVYTVTTPCPIRANCLS